MKINKEIANSILSIEAVEIKGGFRIDAVMTSGEREVIKGKSTRKPSMVQLFSCHANGNFRGDGLGANFTFSKSIEPFYRNCWLKSFVVS